MTINALSRSLSITPSVDGKLYSQYPSGNFPTVVASLAAAGWGQEITEGGTITGPAPLAVHFSARASESNLWADESEAFRKAACHFDFGYDASGRTAIGNWTHSSQPKWKHVGGPITGHVFETPGTYTVRVRVGDGTNTDDASVTVVVQNPDTVYATTDTICLHMGAGGSGGPTGCTYSNISGGAWPTWASNKRYLLHEGADFSSLGAITLAGLNNIQIGSYGSGAKPIVRAITVGTTTAPSSTAFRDYNVVVSDLQQQQGYTLSANGVHMADVLLLRIDNDNGIALNCGINTAWAGYTTAQKSYARWNKRICAVECDAVITGGPRLTTENNAMRINGTTQALIMGCESDPGVYSQPSWTTANHNCEHGFRVFAADSMFCAHNYVHNPLATKHHIKLHSATNGTSASAPFMGDYSDFLNACSTADTGNKGIASRWNVLHYNVLGGGVDDEASWSLEVGVQNSTEMETVRDTIIEFTTHAGHAGASARDVFVRAAQGITVRGITDSTTPAIVFGASAQVNANLWPTYNGPYYTDETSADYADEEGSTVTEVGAFSDPGKPTGAA